MMPNQDQIFSVLRTLIGVGSGFAIGKGLVTMDQATVIGDATMTIVGAAGTLVPLVWGLFVHTDSAKLAAAIALPPDAKLAALKGIPDGAKIAVVEALPGVAQIIVKKSATNGVADAAIDPNRPKVVSEFKT